MEDFTNGIAPDLRSDLEKAKDYQHADTAGDVFVNWIEKTPGQWKKYTPREQDGSLSCMAQAGAKAVEIINQKLGLVFSAHPPYRSRSNFPNGGMYLQNLGDVFKNIGTTTEVLDVSQWQNETDINRPVTVLTPYKVDGYKFVNSKDINNIAEAIELYGHCIVVFQCNKTEWTSKPVYNGGEVNFGHGVCFVDYFLMNGEKIVLQEDSTGHITSFDKKGQRLLTQDFLSKRSIGGMYFLTSHPYIFTKTLRYEMNNSDVSELQKKLQVLGYFPATQTITQYFGNITLKSVKAFQGANGLIPDGIVGKLTNAVLNK